MSSGPEKTPKEVLEEQLAKAKSAYDNFMETESEAYDKELSDLYLSTAGMDENARTLYLGVRGVNQQQLIENSEKRKNFLEEAAVLGREVRSLSQQIRQFEQEEQKKQEKKSFSEAKDALSNSLYEALDVIHSQIPQEAKDVGMTTEMAMKQYLPGLQSKASKIEHYINSVDEVLDFRDLEYIKKIIEQENILV